MSGKSKQKITTPSSDFQPPVLKSKQKSTTSSSRDFKSPLPKTKERKTKDKKTKTVVPPKPSVEDEEGDVAGSGDEEEEDSEEESDSDDDGVDQEGMERLVKLLGEDGLDDFDRAQLRSVAGEEEDEDEDKDESGEEGGSGDEEEVDENEDEISDEDEDEENEVSVVKPTSTDEENEDEDEQNDAIPLDEIEFIIDEDAVPKQKLEIDNQVALERIRQNIQLDPSLPWTETLVITYPQKIEVDVNDDLNRELAFYKQALHSAQSAHTLSIKHKFPFTRPSDYFAEMVKSDSHMERIRQRLLNETAGIKKSEEKRKEREGKKFGKQVQVEKLKERERDKKDMEERLKNLKRKRKDMLDNSKGSKNDEGGDDFDVAVEDAISDRPSKRNKSSSSSSQNDTKKGRMPRQARDKKFGFGGAGRRSKQNTKESTDNFSFGGGRGKKGNGGGGGGAKSGKKQRPGKARRMTARSK